MIMSTTELMEKIYNNLNNTYMSALNQQELAIHCGKTTDSFEKLKSICEKQADKLKTKITFSTQSEIVIPFWTKDFPELICTGIFSKNSLGEVVYKLDFSESTL